GTNKTVTASSLTLVGDDAGNYVLGAATAMDLADVTAKSLTPLIEANDKVYDGNTMATVTVSLGGVLGSDAVTGAAAGTFDSKHVGADKTVTIGAVTLGGADAGNYTVGSAGTATADITPAPLTVSANPASKIVGMADPQLTFVATGYVGGETEATALTGGLTREPGESIGNYTILQGTLAAIAGNYTISYTGANFQIRDTAPVLSITALDAVKAEGDSGSSAFAFMVIREGDTTGETSVDYKVTGSGADFAEADDFGGILPSGTVIFAVGETSQMITVDVSGDTVVEADEGFTVTLSNPSGLATIGTSTATGTIGNDDFVLPTIAASPLTKVYDGLAFSLTATADDGPGGFDPDTDQSRFSFTYYAEPGKGGGIIDAPSHAGSYSVQVAYVGNDVYAPVPSTVFDFTIGQAALTVTADAQNKIYGSADPTLTYQITAGELVTG
ncbi:MAG: hypothetical protein KJ000_34465, partial [Pirellulaceae bacterium]|nr:hypothetical protein [Pirellulaceae bacterium]